MAIPAEDYRHEFVPGSAKDALKAAGARNARMHTVPLDSLVIDENFNVRIKDADYYKRVERIKESIIENGFYENQALSGYAAVHEGKNIIYVTAGFTRLEAAKRAVAMGAPLEGLPVVLARTGTNMVDLTVALDTDNTGTPLSPIERAAVAKRLQAFNLSDAQIARRLGYSKAYINNLLYLISLPAEMRELVTRDKIAAMYVVSKARELGPTEALRVIREGLEQEPVPEPLDDDEVDPEDAPSAIYTPRGRKQGKQAGNISALVALSAIDHTIALMELDFEHGLQWLVRWRRGDKEAREELVEQMKAARKAKRSKEDEPEAVVDRILGPVDVE